MTATRPSKRLTRCSIFNVVAIRRTSLLHSRCASPAGAQPVPFFADRSRQRDDALRQEERAQQNGRVIDEIIVLAEETEQLRQQRDDHGADDVAEHRADAADHEHDDKVRGQVHRKGLGVDVADEVGIERAREAAEHGGQRERTDLYLGDVDAAGLHGVNVVAHGLELAAPLGIDDAPGEPYHKNGHDEDHVVIRDRPLHAVAEEVIALDAAQALCTVCYALHVVQEHADDLREGDGRQGEVHAAQAQARIAERLADEPADAQRRHKAEPRRNAELHIQQAGNVGAHGEHTGRAEVHLAGQAGDEVQAADRDQIDQDLTGDGHIVFIPDHLRQQGCDHGSDQQRQQPEDQLLFLFHAAAPLLIFLPEEALRTEQQERNQKNKGHNILIDRRQDHGGDILDDAEHKAARDTAGHVAEAAQNARCKALQADHIGHGGADIVQRHNQDADAAADHGTDGDGDRHIAVDVDADDRGRRAVLRHAAHGLAGLGLLQVELQQCNDDDRGDDEKQVGF